MRTIALVILSAAALAGCATERALSPSPLPPPVVTLREPGIDFAAGADGRVWLFLYAHRDERRPYAVWDGHTWQAGAFPLTEYSGGHVEHVLERKPGDWFLFVRGQGAQSGVIRFDGTTHSDLGPLPFEYGPPAPQMTADGVIWTISSRGVVTGRQTEPNQLLPPHPLIAENQGSHWEVPAPTRIVDVPGHGAWFWSQVQVEHRYYMGVQPVIPGFHVYEHSTWREVSLPSTKPGDSYSGRLGDVALTKTGELLCGQRYGGFSLFSPATGTETPLSIEVPQDEHCIFLAPLAGGDFLAITAEAIDPPLRPPPKYGGWLGTLLRIDGKTFRSRVLLAGVDFGEAQYEYNYGGRPWIETAAGVFLGSAHSGLVFAPADGGPARRLDWQTGVPFPIVTKLRAMGDSLCVLDRDCGFAILNWRQLLQTRPARDAKQWDVEAIAARPVLAADGAVWYVTAAVPAELRRVQGRQVQRFSLGDVPYPAEDLGYLTFDSKNRLWLISSYPAQQMAFLENDKWRNFATREEAYETVAREEKNNPGFRVGTPADAYFPSFAGDGRVAYRNSWGRMSFFDGKRWEAPNTYCRDENQLEYDFGRLPFYADGVLSVYHRKQQRCYQYRDGQWQPGPDALKPPSLAYVEHESLPAPPASYPGPRDWGHRSSKVLDSAGTLWAGSARELYRGLGDTWVRIPTPFTPLALAGQMTDVLVDSAGDLWFALDWNQPRLAHYHPPEKAPKLAWATSSRKVVKTPDTELRVRGEGTLPMAAFQYRLDDGNWTPLVLKPGQTDVAVSFPMLTNGKHVCEVCAFDALLRASNTLRQEWEVRRDYALETRDSLRLLGSADFATREKASRLLAALGPEALPALTEARKSADKDLAWWLDATIQEINDRAKSSGTASPEKR